MAEGDSVSTQVARDLGDVCKHYVETSAIDNFGIHELCDTICKIGIANSIGQEVPPYGQEFHVAHRVEESDEAGAEQHLKVVFLGDRATGKTNLIAGLCDIEINWHRYMPTKFELHPDVEWEYGDVNISLEVWDTSGDLMQDSSLQLVDLPNPDPPPAPRMSPTPT